MMVHKIPMTINYSGSIPQLHGRGYAQRSFSVSMQPQITMKAKIRDDLKAGGTFVKGMEVVLEKGGPRVNLVR